MKINVPEIENKLSHVISVMANQRIDIELIRVAQSGAGASDSNFKARSGDLTHHIDIPLFEWIKIESISHSGYDENRNQFNFMFHYDWKLLNGGLGGKSFVTINITPEGEIKSIYNPSVEKWLYPQDNEFKQLFETSYNKGKKKREIDAEIIKNIKEGLLLNDDHCAIKNDIDYIDIVYFFRPDKEFRSKNKLESVDYKDMFVKTGISINKKDHSSYITAALMNKESLTPSGVVSFDLKNVTADFLSKKIQSINAILKQNGIELFLDQDQDEIKNKINWCANIQKYDQEGSHDESATHMLKAEVTPIGQETISLIKQTLQSDTHCNVKDGVDYLDVNYFCLPNQVMGSNKFDDLFVKVGISINKKDHSHYFTAIMAREDLSIPDTMVTSELKDYIADFLNGKIPTINQVFAQHGIQLSLEDLGNNERFDAKNQINWYSNIQEYPNEPFYSAMDLKENLEALYGHQEVNKESAQITHEKPNNEYDRKFVITRSIANQIKQNPDCDDVVDNHDYIDIYYYYDLESLGNNQSITEEMSEEDNGSEDNSIQVILSINTMTLDSYAIATPGWNGINENLLITHQLQQTISDRFNQSFDDLKILLKNEGITISSHHLSWEANNMEDLNEEDDRLAAASM